MLDGVTAGLGIGAIGQRPDPQKAFAALELNKTTGASTERTEGVGNLASLDARSADDGQEATRQDNRPPPPPPPPGNSGGVDAQSLVEGLLQAAEGETAQDNTAAAQSLYMATKGQFLG